jgi:hypothetical protein
LPTASDARLSITRDGAATTPEIPCKLCWLIDDPSTLRVVDLDRDGQAEVMVSSYSGGAHCCTTGLLYFYDQGAWKRMDVETGNSGYRLMDLDGDLRTEVVTRDERFTDAWTSHAASAAPPLVMQFDRGAMQDLTRERRAHVRADAKDLLGTLRSRSSRFDRRGLLAAYVADQYLLGRGSVGLREITRNLGHAQVTKAFRKSLLRRLELWGYRPRR